MSIKKGKPGRLPRARNRQLTALAFLKATVRNRPVLLALEPITVDRARPLQTNPALHGRAREQRLSPKSSRFNLGSRDMNQRPKLGRAEELASVAYLELLRRR